MGNMIQSKSIDLKNWSWSIIYLLVIIDLIIYVLINIFSTINIVSRIYLYLIMYSLSSAIIVMILVEIFRIKSVILISLFEYKKKPRIFEFGFFFFSFLATFFTIFAAGLYNTPGPFFAYLKNNWYFMLFYGIAFACGWYHYILQIDC